MAQALSETYDVVVVGGGSAGVAAACGAARAGANTLLVERYGFLGGAATHSIVLAYCGLYGQGASRPELMVGGIATQVLRHMAELGAETAPRQSPSTGNWVAPINPEALKIALDRTARMDRLTVSLHTNLLSCATGDGALQAVDLLDDAGVRRIRAKDFVDASGECNLAHLAGAPPSAKYAPGRRGAPASFPVRIGGAPGDLAVDRPAIQAALAALPDALGRARLRRQGWFMTHLPASDEMWWLAVDLVADGLDGFDMGEAERDGREMTWRAVASLRASVPGFERAHVTSTGPQLGIRETRHVGAVEDVTEVDAASGRQRDDGVARAAWPMEIHHGPGDTEYRRIGRDGYFHVPLGALRERTFGNLWLAGRTIGAEPAAFASTRVMGTAFATGHAAGVGAALQAGGAAPTDLVHRVRTELLAQDAIL